MRLVPHPFDTDQLWAAAARSVYHSTDGGRSWAFITTLPDPITSLVSDPFNSSRLYATTASTFAVSEDAGATWTYPSTVGELPAGSLYGLSASPRVRGLLYIASALGVYRSSNDGGRWTLLASEPGADRMRTVTASPVEDGVVFGTRTGESGVGGETYRSDNYGVTWKEIFSLPLQVTFSPHQPERGITNGSPPRITNDGGATWSPLLAPHPVLSNVAFDSSEPGLVYGASYATKHFLKSEDYGMTWRGTEHRLPHTPATQIVATGTRLLTVLAGYGVFELVGDSWISRNTGVREAWVSALVVTGSSKLLAGTFGSGLFESDEGLEWKQVPDIRDYPLRYYSGGDVVNDLTSADGKIFAATARGLYRMHEDETWVELEFEHSRGVRRMALGPSPNEIYCATWRGVWKSTDGGTTWTQLPGPLADKDVNQIAYDTHSGFLLASVRNGEALLYVSPDGGASWQPVTPPFNNVLRIDVAPSGQGIFLISQGGGLFNSQNGGVTWTRVTGDQGESWTSWIRCVAFDPANRKAILIGTSLHGVYVSGDGGATYEYLGLPDRWITGFVNGGGKWYAGTDKGVFVTGEPLLNKRRRPARR